jgi:hypothetical protein
MGIKPVDKLPLDVNIQGLDNVIQDDSINIE